MSLKPPSPTKIEAQTLQYSPQTVRDIPSLQDILSHSTILGEYLKKSEQLVKLNRIILKNLVPSLQPYCRVKSYNDNILTIVTSSPTWGHSLRFKVPELLETLRKHPSFYAIKAIHPKVEPCLHLSQQKPDRTLEIIPLSYQSASLIAETAKGVVSLKLRSSLIRLANRAKLPVQETNT